jgi:hypothetical protein
MKRAIIITCGIALSGCLLGLWLGWHSASSAAVQDSNKLTSFSATHRTQGKNVLSPEGPHDFKALTHRQALLNGLSPECLDALKHQNASQLKELLLNLCDPEIRPGIYRSQKALSQLRFVVAKELYLLEKDTAMRWALSTDNSNALLMVWAAAAQEDSSMIKTWMSAYHESSNPSRYLSAVFNKAYQGAASRGAAALIAFEDEFNYGTTASLAELPDDFDFQSYFNRPKPQNKEFIRVWAACNPDAVDAYLKERQSSPQRDYGEMRHEALEAKCLMISEQEAARWVLPHLDTLEIKLNYVSTGLANALLDAMPDDKARINYLANNLFYYDTSSRNLNRAKQILDRLNPSQQADTYSRWIDSWQNSIPMQASGISHLEEYLKISQIPEDEQTRLIEKARQTGK